MKLQIFFLSVANELEKFLSKYLRTVLQIHLIHKTYGQEPNLRICYIVVELRTTVHWFDKPPFGHPRACIRCHTCTLLGPVQICKYLVYKHMYNLKVKCWHLYSELTFGKFLSIV